MSYRHDENTGNTVKVTQKIRTIVTQARVNPKMAERKKWPKFGGALKTHQTTTATEEFDLKLALKSQINPDQQANTQIAKDAAKLASSGGTLMCRTCGGEHFTSKCPMKGYITDTTTAGGAAANKPDGPGGPGGEIKSAYVAPHARRGGPPSAAGGPHAPGGYPDRNERDENTLRVTNLGEDILEEDIKPLFARCGMVSRCNILRDRVTGRSRGFGFVTFNDIGAAKLAAEKLNGFPLDNLIMSVEFATKRDK